MYHTYLITVEKKFSNIFYGRLHVNRVKISSKVMKEVYQKVITSTTDEELDSISQFLSIACVVFWLVVEEFAQSRERW